MEDDDDGEETDVALVEAQEFPEPTLVTILVDGGGCRVVEARPIGSTRPAGDLPCGACREQLLQLVGNLTTVRSQPRAWTLLTERERETCELAARGLTNRAIVDRLGTSVRTVENHLARSYEKLGISGRVELRLLLAVAPEPRPARHLEAVPPEDAG